MNTYTGTNNRLNREVTISLEEFVMLRDTEQKLIMLFDVIEDAVKNNTTANDILETHIKILFPTVYDQILENLSEVEE